MKDARHTLSGALLPLLVAGALGASACSEDPAPPPEPAAALAPVQVRGEAHDTAVDDLTDRRDWGRERAEHLEGDGEIVGCEDPRGVDVVVRHAPADAPRRDPGPAHGRPDRRSCRWRSPRLRRRCHRQ